MASMGDIAAGMKIRLLADLDLFPEGIEGTVKEVRAQDDEIWHAIVTWSDKARKQTQMEEERFQSEAIENTGAGDWNRTSDLRFTKPLLYHLSYAGCREEITQAGQQTVA